MLAAVAIGVQTASHAQEYTYTHIATHYGISYHGQRMGCGGIYDTNNPTILAVPPALYHIPCGTQFVVEGPAGSISVQRTDSCPGCTSNMIDLSEAGVLQVCGGIHTCRVNFTRVE